MKLILFVAFQRGFIADLSRSRIRLRNSLHWLPLTHGLQLKLNGKYFSLLFRTCSSSRCPWMYYTNPAQFQFETYAHISLPACLPAVFPFFPVFLVFSLFSLFLWAIRRLRQTNSKPNCASCEFLLLFAANVRAWATLELAVKRTFSIFASVWVCVYECV